jgi:hypothetical protein
MSLATSILTRFTEQVGKNIGDGFGPPHYDYNWEAR